MIEFLFLDKLSLKIKCLGLLVEVASLVTSWF